MTLASPLAGCQYIVDVQVSGAVDRVVVEVPAARRGWFTSKVSIDGLDVWDRAGTVASGPAWAINREHDGCRDRGRVRVTYGQRPAGFYEIAPARPLIEGGTYGVRVSGCGIAGDVKFKIVSGRVVQI